MEFPVNSWGMGAEDFGPSSTQALKPSI
jgi:hypothetical protein